MNFTTSDNVANFLNKTSLTLNESATISMLIEMVDGVIKNYCGWEVLAKDYSDTLSGDGTSSLYLKQAPVNALTSLVVGTDDITASASLISEDGIITLSSESGLTFTSGTDNIKIIYNAGYVTVPSDLTYAASWLCAMNYNKITQESIGITKEQFNNVSVEYDKNDLPKLVKDVLDRYRNIGIY